MGDPALAGEGISEDRPPCEAGESSYLLGRQNGGQQSGPDWPELRVKRTDAYRVPDGEENQPVNDLGGEQPGHEAFHSLQGSAEHWPFHCLPPAPDQGCARQAVPGR